MADNLLVSKDLKDKIKWYIRAHGHSSIGGLGLISTYLKFSGRNDLTSIVDGSIKLFEEFAEAFDFQKQLDLLKISVDRIGSMIGKEILEKEKKDELLDIVSGVGKNIFMIESIMTNPFYEEKFLVRDLVLSACVQILKRHPGTINGDLIGDRGEGIGQRIVFHFKESEPDRKIICGGYEIQLLFFNLISNAIDAIQGVGNIYLEVSYEENTLLIEFYDDGRLISDENLKKIGYGEFFSTKGKLHGHGLQIIRDIVGKYNGKLTIINDDDRHGVVFKIKLNLKH